MPCSGVPMVGPKRVGSSLWLHLSPLALVGTAAPGSGDVRDCGLAGDELGDGLVQAARAGFLDEHRELVRAHLHALAEVVGDDDCPLRGRFVIDEQLGAAAAALAAEQCESGKTAGVIHNGLHSGSFLGDNEPSVTRG